MIKNLLYLFLFVFSLVAKASEIIVLNSEMYGIDHNKKLIVSNNSVESLNVIYPNLKTVISLDVNYTFSVPVQTIEVGSPYEVVHSGNSQIYTLYFTEFPLIHITTPHTIVDAPKVWASFRLTESNGDSILSDIGIEYRGGYSQTLAKKSMEIEFWEDNTGEETVDYSLLGMRSDDDWNLQPMFNEPLRFLSKTNNDLWRLFHTIYYIADEPEAVNGIKMTYSEMFINGDYRGVYAVSEKIDRKQLKLKNHNGAIRGELYKGDQWGNGAVTFNWVGPFDNNSDVWDGFEYKHPDEEINWSNLYNLVDFVKNGTDTDFYAQYQNKFHLDNMVDYFIFLNVLRATDNTGKNLYLAKYNTNEPYFYVPWDLDGTFGIIWDGSQQNITTGLLTNKLYNRLWLDCSENGFREKLQTRWNSVKETIFNHEFLMDMFEENYDYLLNNGVYQREEIAWEGYLTEFDHLDYMSSWITNRLDYLDTQFNEICAMNVSDILANNTKMYPNPATDYLYFKHNSTDKIEISIYDLQGKLLVEAQSESAETPITISTLKNGIYMVQIKSGNNHVQTQKLVVTK